MFLFFKGKRVGEAEVCKGFLRQTNKIQYMGSKVLAKFTGLENLGKYVNFNDYDNHPQHQAKELSDILGEHTNCTGTPERAGAIEHRTEGIGEAASSTNWEVTS